MPRDERQDAHQQAWDAMPWVLNGRADTAQCERLHQHLRHCEACREEWAFQQQLHGALTRAPRPVEEMLARFWAEAPHGETDALAWGEPEPLTADAPPPERAGPQRRPRGLGYTLAAGLVLALVAAGLGRLSAPAPATADYRLLSEGSAAGLARLRLVPAPGMTLAELQALLAREGLQIVETAPDGRHFGLAALPGRSGATPLQMAQRLRAQPGVMLAEPLP